MSILVTGVSGFIGYRLANKLIDQNLTVLGCDLENRCGDLNDKPGFSCRVGDICDISFLDNLPWHEIDTVYHLAAAGVKATRRDWSICCQVNVMGTAAILNALSRHTINSVRAPLFIYTKSFYEDHWRMVPTFRDNPYVMTKAAATAMLITWSLSYHGGVRIAKVYQVFGPSDDSGNVLTYAVKQMKQAKQARFGSGVGLRDWIYIDDLIDALSECRKKPEPGLVHLDFGRGILVSVRDMIERVADLMGVSRDLLIFDENLDRGDIDLVDRATTMPIRLRQSMDMDALLERMINEVTS